MLVVATRSHWAGASAELMRRGSSPQQAIDEGRLTVLDAAETLKQFMRAERPDPTLFQEVVGSLVTRLADSPGRLRIYGEMVDVLAEDGNLQAAQRLEELWNVLAAGVPFDLFCGYASGHFSHERSAGALRDICYAHTDVHCVPDDMLGNFLIEKSRLS